MFLHRKDIELISEIVAEFPDIQTFKIDSDSTSGIGTIVKLTLTTKVMGRDADVTFEISGVKDW
jgi:hypothetical protein